MTIERSDTLLDQLQKKNFNTAINLLMLLNGLLCLLFSHKIIELLPTICGLMIVIKGAFNFTVEFKNDGHKNLENIDFEKSIISIAIGIGILLKQQNSLFLIGVFWGLEGLSHSLKLLNELFYRIHHNKKYFLLLIETLIEFVLSMLLVFEPYHSVEHHIILLGLELVLESLMNIFIKQFKSEPEEINSNELKQGA